MEWLKREGNTYIKYRKIIYIFILLCYIPNMYFFSNISIYGKIMWQALVIVILGLLLYPQWRYLCKQECLLMGFVIWTEFSTFCNSGFDLYNLIMNLLEWVPILLLFIAARNISTERYQNIIHMLSTILSVLLVINTLCLKVFPHGFDQIRMFTDQEMYFLGTKLFITELSIFTIVCCRMNELFILKKTRIYWSVIIYFLAIYNAALTDNATGIIVLLVFLFCFIFSQFDKRGRILVVTFGIIIIFGMWFILSEAYINNPIVVWIIEDVLGKNINLTGRISIYRLLPELVMRQWGVGYGYNNDTIFRNIGLYHAHNSFLQIMLDYGLGGFILWILFLVSVFRKATANVNSVVRIGLVGCIAILVGSIGDNCIGKFYYFTLIMTISAQSIEKAGKIYQH